jgi:CubicO group peptidase (beta-lactamase class C family)
MRAMSDKSTADLIRDLYAGRLTPGAVASAMMTSGSFFPTATVRRGDTVQPLQVGATITDLAIAHDGRSADLVDYLAMNRVTGLLILKDGAIIREDYELGLTGDSHHASFSLAKSVCSTLVGCALADGSLRSLDLSLGHLLPALAGSAYADVPLASLLSMRTGVAWDETYTRPHSDRRRFLEAQLSAQPGALMQVMRQLPRTCAINERFNYNTGETFLVGAVLEAVTGCQLSKYLSERLWKPLGMQSDATWWLESQNGAGMGGSGLAATLRDYGRFAQFIINNGHLDGRQLVPEDWFHRATQPATDGTRYGYQWWLPATDDPRHAGAFMGMGIFGQRLYINPARQLAIVVLCARSKPSDSHVISDESFFGAVVESLC